MTDRSALDIEEIIVRDPACTRCGGEGALFVGNPRHGAGKTCDHCKGSGREPVEPLKKILSDNPPNADQQREIECGGFYAMQSTNRFN